MYKLLCELITGLHTNICLSKSLFISLFGLLLLCVKVALLLGGVVDSSRELHVRGERQLVQLEGKAREIQKVLGPNLCVDGADATTISLSDICRRRLRCVTNSMGCLIA